MIIIIIIIIIIIVTKTYKAHMTDVHTHVCSSASVFYFITDLLKICNARRDIASKWSDAIQYKLQ